MIFGEHNFVKRLAFFFYSPGIRMMAVDSIGSKSLNLRKKVGVKFTNLFILSEWLEGNFSHFSMILPLDFSVILNICRNYSLFIFQLIL